ncbi:hypothetical protein BJX70DRAFT_380029 [Aspergillus crustosus]
MTPGKVGSPFGLNPYSSTSFLRSSSASFFALCLLQSHRPSRTNIATETTGTTTATAIVPPAERPESAPPVSVGEAVADDSIVEDAPPSPVVVLGVGVSVMVTVVVVVPVVVSSFVVDVGSCVVDEVGSGVEVDVLSVVVEVSVGVVVGVLSVVVGVSVVVDSVDDADEVVSEGVVGSGVVVVSASVVDVEDDVLSVDCSLSEVEAEGSVVVGGLGRELMMKMESGHLLIYSVSPYKTESSVSL